MLVTRSNYTNPFLGRQEGGGGQKKYPGLDPWGATVRVVDDEERRVAVLVPGRQQI